MDFLNIVLWIILVVIIILILILFFGVRISLIINKKQSLINGFVNIKIFNNITIFKKEFPSKEDKKYENKELSDKSSSPRYQLENIKPLIPNIKKLIPHFIDFLKNILKSIEIRKFNMHFDLGFENYAETAKIVGYIWGIAMIPNTTLKSMQITAKPIFEEPTLDFNINMDITIKLLKVFQTIVKLLFKKDSIKLIINIIKVWRKKR